MKKKIAFRFHIIFSILLLVFMPGLLFSNLGRRTGRSFIKNLYKTTDKTAVLALISFKLHKDVFSLLSAIKNEVYTISDVLVHSENTEMDFTCFDRRTISVSGSDEILASDNEWLLK